MQYYVVKEDVSRLASKKGMTTEELAKKVFPTRTSLRHLILDVGPTRDALEIHDLAELLQANDPDFVLTKEEPFDFSSDADDHLNDPLDYDSSHFERDSRFSGEHTYEENFSRMEEAAQKAIEAHA